MTGLPLLKGDGEAGFPAGTRGSASPAQPPLRRRRPPLYTRRTRRHSEPSFRTELQSCECRVSVLPMANGAGGCGPMCGPPSNQTQDAHFQRIRIVRARPPVPAVCLEFHEFHILPISIIRDTPAPGPLSGYIICSYLHIGPSRTPPDSHLVNSALPDAPSAYPRAVVRPSAHSTHPARRVPLRCVGNIEELWASADLFVAKV